MAFKKLGSSVPESHSFGTEKTLEGILVEKKENVGPNNSLAFIIEKKGGKKVTVWGSAKLNDLNQLVVGTTVKITYLGKKKNDKTGREFNAYDIEYDDSTADVAKLMNS